MTTTSTNANKSTPEAIPVASEQVGGNKVSSPGPPPNVPAGGAWGRVKYGGDTTGTMCILLCLLTGIFSGCGTFAYLCPCDEKDGYKVNNTVYDHTGAVVGKASEVTFSPY